MPPQRPRQERYLAKLKESPEKWKNFLEKERLKKKEYRVRKKKILADNIEALKKQRKKDRERQALCRKKKREAAISDDLTHSKYSAFTYIKAIMDHFKNQCNKLDRLTEKC